MSPSIHLVLGPTTRAPEQVAGPRTGFGQEERA